jgi:hypothetical protein
MVGMTVSYGNNIRIFGKFPLRGERIDQDRLFPFQENAGMSEIGELHSIISGQILIEKDGEGRRFFVPKERSDACTTRNFALEYRLNLIRCSLGRTSKNTPGSLETSRR